MPPLAVRYAVGVAIDGVFGRIIRGLDWMGQIAHQLALHFPCHEFCDLVPALIASAV